MSPIIDEIGKKLSSAGQKSVKAVSDFSQTTKLKDQIVEEKNKISLFYMEIGENYYRLNKKKPNIQFVDIINQIKLCEERINDIEREIQVIQNVKVCPNCEETIDYGAAFCPKCGFAFNEDFGDEEGESIYCTYCGTQVPADSDFCIECGQPIVSPAAEDSLETQDAEINNEPGIEENDSKEVEQEEETAVCPNCGKELFPEAVFCSECRTRVA